MYSAFLCPKVPFYAFSWNQPVGDYISGKSDSYQHGTHHFARTLRFCAFSFSAVRAQASLLHEIELCKIVLSSALCIVSIQVYSRHCNSVGAETVCRLFCGIPGNDENRGQTPSRFLLDVTKPAFLKEGFTISRVEGSTGGGACGCVVSEESRAAGKRSLSRPSRGQGTNIFTLRTSGTLYIAYIY